MGKNRGGDLQDVQVWVLKDETNMVTYVRAARGKLEVDAPNRRVILHLYDGKTVTMREGQNGVWRFRGTAAATVRCR